MADDRYRPTDFPGGFQDRDRDEYGRDYGYGRDHSYSSARDYRAAGDYDRNFRRGGTGYGEDRRPDGGRENYVQGNRDYYGGRGGYGGDHRGNYGSGGLGGSYGPDGRRLGEGERDWRRDSGQRRDYGRAPQGYDYEDRGFFARAGDEVRSWFGDDEAERRREADQRYDERFVRDDDYDNWRRRQIDALDRDYHEYRRENATRFENEFGSWRNERQTQRDSLGRVSEHMDVIGSDGEHVGTVDKVRGDRVILTKNDADAGGRHHSIPSRWIQSVDDKVTIRKTADDAKKHWRDEERSGALFGDDRTEGYGRDQKVDLNRSFSGTYR